ncbi:MAG: Flp pilus assembly protein CpaB [Nitratireductor sp.]|nr:Flp pilus assembly protein CpaB [Nitratireductor sp.]
MRKAQLLALAGALLGAGGAGYLALSLSTPEPQPVVQQQPVPTIPSVDVLVASNDISMGTKVTEDMLRWQEWPESGVSDGFVTRKSSPEAMSEMTGSIARSTIFSGEPLRASKLVHTDQGFMSAILPKGQRAIATSISTATSAGGFILPNDRVDVLMTRRRTGEGEEGFTTEVILENVRVLAIDQTIQEKDGEQVVVGETATLQLNPKEVEILTVAQQTADRLSLALRSIADANEVPSKLADHLLAGGSGTVRVIRYGNVKESFAPPKPKEDE